VRQGQGMEMLAGAKPHLKPDLAYRHRKAVPGRARLRWLKAESRQKLGQEFGLRTAQPGSLAPPIELAARPFRMRTQNALFRMSTRSVFSQEKPPSASGVRPK
jgi:hypothetical protein